LGHGTTVKLYLPRTLEGEAAAHPAEEITIERGSGETILVAEDEDGVRASVGTQLVELGYRVLTVANGEEALNIISDGKRVDLLFTDVVMPGLLSGRALAKEARKLAPALPVLYTSGYTESVIDDRDHADEGIALLHKPYGRTQLAHAIRSSLPSSKAAPLAANERPDEHSSCEVSIATTDSVIDATDRPANILLVEDDGLIRFDMVDVLEQHGHCVTAAAKPAEALQVLGSDVEVDVLITDFALPEMNGVELIRMALVRRPDLAVILASGHNIDETILPNRKITVLNKPFRPQDLRAAIQRSLSLRGGS
jgi:CheY-like chemotaxis protein